MRTALLLLMLLASALPKLPTSEEIGEETARATQVYQVEEGLEDEEREICGTLWIDGSYDSRGALGRLWDRFLEMLRERFRDEMRFAFKIIGVAVLCSLAATLYPRGAGAASVEIAACCAVSLLLAGSIGSLISQGTETLERLSDYAKASMPAFFSTVAACGATVSASVKYAAASLAAELFMELSQRLVLPAIYAYLAIAVSGSLFDQPILKTALRCAKWCAVTSMSLLTTAFCAYISLSGIISGSADAVTVRTTKTVISSVFPVVGGILSDSASAMLAAAGLIKNTAGVFCLIAVCVLCSGAFAALSVKMLVLKGAAAVAELTGGERLSRLLGNLGTGFGMLLGLVGCYGFLLFLSIMSGIRMVNA